MSITEVIGLHLSLTFPCRLFTDLRPTLADVEMIQHPLNRSWGFGFWFWILLCIGLPPTNPPPILFRFSVSLLTAG